MSPPRTPLLDPQDDYMRELKLPPLTQSRSASRESKEGATPTPTSSNRFSAESRRFTARFNFNPESLTPSSQPVSQSPQPTLPRSQKPF